jgi:hypothetical protein
MPPNQDLVPELSSALFRAETTFFASDSASLTAALAAGVDSSFSDWSARRLMPYPKVPPPWVVCTL